MDRRWTPPEVSKLLMVAVLQGGGGHLEADELFLELENRADDRVLPGDREPTPEGEPRWRYAARRACQTLINEGLTRKGQARRRAPDRGRTRVGAEPAPPTDGRLICGAGTSGRA
jgi:hypothetical protein